MVSKAASADGGQAWRLSRPLELSPMLSGALEVFYERGYHGASVRDIARRVGVTVPALYYHYENKQAMLVTLLETGMGEVLDRAWQAAKDAIDDPEQRLANLVEAIVLYMTDWVSVAYLDTELRYLDPENRKRYAALRKQLEQLLTNTIEEGTENGVFAVSHPDDTTRALLGMCQAIATWYHPEGPHAPAEIAERYVEIALNAVGARVQRKPTSGKRSTRSRRTDPVE
ncbi:TetR/AcrR family transcriptional regulator [Streptomyces cadmiisoli]|nr:TetR/AcrR family transcriptional regulator [Streptomyces cadmiisoli]